MTVNGEMNRKLKIGFALGLIVAVIGVALRVAAPLLSWDPIGDGVWSKNAQTEQMFVQLSLASIVFGLAVLVVTLNRWLQYDGSNEQERIRSQQVAGALTHSPD